MATPSKKTRAAAAAGPASATPDFIDLSPRELTKVEFGKRLEALMLSKGWTQSELGRHAKIGRDAISTYVRGVSFPEPLNLKKLAKALHVAEDTLLPNKAIGAMQNDSAPMMEIKQAHGRPNDVWIRLNRIVPFTVAAKIVDLLNKEAK